MKKTKVVYAKWGLANFYNDHIEINQSLKSKKKLRDYIIQHELGHKKQFDLMHEFDFKFALFYLIAFIIVHPTTWIDFSPIQYRNKALVYDSNILMLYFIITILLYVFSIIIFKII